MQKISIVLSVSLACILFFQILLPANNRSVWYDELDSLMIGQLTYENNGQISESLALPLDFQIFNDEGKTHVYQDLWIFLNTLVHKYELPFPLWRSLTTLALVLALTLWSYHRLAGPWIAAPFLLGMFSDLFVRGGGVVRSYGLAALALVLCLLVWEKRKLSPWPLALAILFLWQINLAGFVLFALPHGISLLWRLRDPQLRRQDKWLWVLYLVIGFFQIKQMWQYDQELFTYHLSIKDQLAVIWRVINFKVMGLTALVPVILIFGWQKSGGPRWALSWLILCLLILPATLPFFRSVYCLMILPVIFVEFCVALKSARKPWGVLIFAIACFTQMFSLPTEVWLPKPNPKTFHDSTTFSKDWLRKTPLASIFESRHRKWSQDDALCSYILENAQPKDRLLYEYSRLSPLARLWAKAQIPVTGIFSEEHPYTKAKENSALMQPTPPFWAFTPLDASITAEKENLNSKEMVKKLSQWGHVTVHKIPLREQGWIPNSAWPPKMNKNQDSGLRVYYVQDTAQEKP